MRALGSSLQPLLLPPPHNERDNDEYDDDNDDGNDDAGNSAAFDLGLALFAALAFALADGEVDEVRGRAGEAISTVRCGKGREEKGLQGKTDLGSLRARARLDEYVVRAGMVGECLAVT